MADSLVLEVDKEGNIKLQAQAVRLPSGVTLLASPAPTVEAQKLTKSDPETWDVAEGVTIDQVEITDRIDIRRLPTVVVLGTSQAIQFRWKKDPDPQPDATDDPKPAGTYRVVIVARRSDGYDWVGKPKVRVFA